MDKQSKIKTLEAIRKGQKIDLSGNRVYNLNKGVISEGGRTLTVNQFIDEINTRPHQTDFFVRIVYDKHKLANDPSDQVIKELRDLRSAEFTSL